MKALDILARACWHEFYAGVKSGIVSFTFVGLTAYLALSLTSAEYMQTLGATDVPRNAAAVVYLMTTGFMFFLFFAWAWIFAQPVLRDRSVSLHEIVLTAPISLKLLMCGRYFGACLLGIFLGCAVLCGFFVAPLLEVAGWLPPGSFAATPWSQFGFALVWLIIPTTMGVGALYLIAAIVSRSIVGPLCASVFIILVWMFCAVTLTEGDVNVTLAGVLDPSLFSFTLAETDLWTPDQKASAFLPLQWDFLANRFVWAGLPVIAFAIVLSRLDRERLISSIETTGAPNKADHRDAETVIQGVISSEEPARSWMRVYLRECGWQVSQVFQSRAFWIGAIILLCVGLSNAFIHIIWHADGPLLPDPNLMVREVNTSLYLVVVFILAALVGLVSRRDSVAGMDEMLDGLSTPDSLRLTARAVAVFLAVVVLTLVPGLAVVIATLLAGPSFLSPAFVFQAQMLVVAPAQIEAAMIIFLIHALIRHTGLAYGVSMFVVLVLILNHELGLTSYPPFEVGVPARMAFSPLTGWVPWLNYVATLGIYKITFGLFLVGAAALVLPRGFNSRLQHGGETIRERVRMRPGLIMLVVVVGLSSSFWVLTKQLVENGGYKSADASRAEDAAWERQWSQDLGDLAFSIQGGELHVSVNTSTPEVVGHWELKRVVASSEFLYATAPAGLVDIQARVNGRSTQIRIENDLIRLHLGACGAQGCDVVLDWTVRQQGWPSAAEAPWITRAGVWAHASQIVPTLGLDPDRVMRAGAYRQSHALPLSYELPPRTAAAAVDGVAPAASWSWQIDYDETVSSYELPGPVKGRTDGPLTFAIFGGQNIVSRSLQDVSVHSAAGDESVAGQIAADVRDMQNCVARRLHKSSNVGHIVRWPDRSSASTLAGRVLLLSEAPHWHVRNGGVGHLMRRAKVAHLIAREHVLQTTELRQEPGSIWLSDGIAGAVGLLCVGDTDGLVALSQLLTRYSEMTTKALASSAVPVGPLKHALSDGWAREYAPQAALAWVAGRSPDSVNAFLKQLSKGLSLESALSEILGASSTRVSLGAPWRSTLEFGSDGDTARWNVRRHRWDSGAWVTAEANANLRALIASDTGVRLTDIPTSAVLSADIDDRQMLIVDDWFSYRTGAALFPHSD